MMEELKGVENMKEETKWRIMCAFLGGCVVFAICNIFYLLS